MTGASELLALLDSIAGLGPIARAVSVLGVAAPELSAEQRWRLPLGERNRRLARLRVALFGPRLPCVAACPDCGELLEFDFPVAALEEPGVDEGEWRGDGVRAALRVPDSEDLLALGASDDPDAALVARCVDVVEGDPQRLDPAAALAALAALDPAADVLVDLVCVDCGRTWDAPLDLPALLERELLPEGDRLLDAVHALAGAYGWSEQTVLGMSARRREAYLARVYA